MADVAAPISLSNGGGGCGGGGGALGIKRKAEASVSRGKALKGRNDAVEFLDQSPPALLKMVESELRKPDPLKMRRLDEVYPNRKPVSSQRLFSAKLNPKGNLSIDESTRMKDTSLLSNLNPRFCRELNGCDNSAALSANAEDTASKQCPTIEKCSEIRFRSVDELALGKSEQISSSAAIDMLMEKALKGFGTCGPSYCGLSFSSLGKHGEPRSKFPGFGCSELHISGRKVPLDLTLKTTMCIVSSSPVSWFHRLVMSGTFDGMALPNQLCNDSNTSCVSDPLLAAADYRVNWSSWLYPQSSLPSSVIAALTSAKGGAEADFLSKRQRDWEDSLRNLYYKLRKNACNIFYVCTSQFVAMFTAVGAGGKTKRKFNAFVSQSTRSLRSLLKEQDVSFTMPLCSSEVEQTNREDLVEFSEIEKLNLGKTKRQTVIAHVDNSPQSLLAFHGNDRTHGLFDFLLNYKFLLPSLATADVPVLCAPVPFRNAASSAPEVMCKEIKGINHLASKFDGSTLKDDTTNVDSSTGIRFSIEIKDGFITPWAMASICAAIGSDGKSFEASFTVEPNSLGLNVALDEINQKADSEESKNGESNETSYPLGITSEVASELRSAWIKALKCCNGQYSASLSPI